MPNTPFTLADLPSLVGKELGTSDWIAIDQHRIQQFADCTGDQQWIHVDVERAQKESPFGAPIAHGFLTLSLLSEMSASIGAIPRDAVAAFNYGLDKVRFLTPVKVGARVRSHATLVQVTPQGAGRQLIKVLHSIEIEGEAKPAMVAEALAVLVGPA